MSTISILRARRTIFISWATLSVQEWTTLTKRKRWLDNFLQRPWESQQVSQSYFAPLCLSEFTLQVYNNSQAPRVSPLQKWQASTQPSDKDKMKCIDSNSPCSSWKVNASNLLSRSRLKWASTWRLVTRSFKIMQPLSSRIRAEPRKLTKNLSKSFLKPKSQWWVTSLSKRCSKDST